MRTWVIGSSPDCDVVVDSPLASARHCQLTQTAEGFVLFDLGSTNGTYVNGLRIAVPTRLTTSDSITLGRTVSFPWPPELTTSLRIGRLAENDIVLDDARVSGHHARLIVVAGSQTLIEDIGSSNGTFLNSDDRRVKSPTVITGLDTVYFGTLAVPAARLLAGLRKPEALVPIPPVPPPVAAITEQRREPIPALPAAMANWEQHRWLLAWLAQAPVCAVLIVAIFGRQVTAANWQSVGQGIAATTFALALAAIWLGSSLAIAEVAGVRWPVRQISVDPARSFVSVAKRLTVLASLCFVACAVLLAVVYWGSGLKGRWLAMWGVLVMTSLVGLFLGLAVSAPIRSWFAATSVLVICLIVMIALGGWIRPLPTMSLPVQLTAEAMPSRWVFEALLLLEADQHSAPVTPEETGPVLAADHDFVEGFFPANSERMGVTADATALGLMLIGLAVLALFASWPSRVAPSPISSA